MSRTEDCERLNERLNKILDEAFKDVFENTKNEHKYPVSPEPSELPIPSFNNKKNLVLILSNNMLSNKQLEILKKEDVLDKFEITYDFKEIESKDSYDFKEIESKDSYDFFGIDCKKLPSVYNRKTKRIHTGYGNYSTIIESLSLPESLL